MSFSDLIPSMAQQVREAANSDSRAPWLSPEHAVQGWSRGIYFQGIIVEADEAYLIVRVSEFRLDNDAVSYADIEHGDLNLIPPGTRLRFKRSECDPLDDLTKTR